MRNYFIAIGKIQKCISKAETLDEAFQGSLQIIIDSCRAEQAVIWYADKNDNETLHPYYWISPIDLTERKYAPGEGIVGKVYESQEAAYIPDFQAAPDKGITEDFSGVDVGSMICVPFSNEHEKLGCIQIINTAGNENFTDEDVDLCEIIVLMAAMAIEDSDIIAEPWHMGEPIIVINDVCREFRNGEHITKVLKGVNLNIYKGEFVALLGESGCGKSTLLNIIGGMDQATSGTFTYEGVDYSNATQDQLTDFRRDNIGFIFQSYNLMPNLNAKQNLDFIAELVDDPMDSDEALELVGLGERKTNYPSQLSGGQQQRVSIARALVKKPKLILADEPTAALDYETSIEVLSVMERIVEAGTTLVMVTHNEEITRMADRVIRMRDGRMYEAVLNRHRAKAEELVW
ncbi:MAG: ATP-binding cassette domain-containing protein [Bacillota bacterium]|nr:ATP-binding cassette domain-containing protein [Bacillota bacterium]